MQPVFLQAQRLPIPITLLTGFLGSGKTTLLNRLLRHPGLAATMVVINEFGEVGLDHELIEQSSENLVLMPNGCLCCTVHEDLLDTLRSLAMRRAQGQIDPFNRIVIETTGLADPVPILQSLLGNRHLLARFRVDGVITTVDAATGSSTLDRQAEAVKQAAVADRIVVTKTDLVPSHTVEALRARIASLNPAASLFDVADGVAEPARLFDAGLYDPQARNAEVRRWLGEESSQWAQSPRSTDPNRHDDRIRANHVIFDQPIDVEALDHWLDFLFAMRGPDLLRIKGIVNVQGLPGPLVIHSVQDVFHPPMMLKTWPSPDRRTRVVFIGRDLDEALLRDTFEIFRGERRLLTSTGQHRA